MTGLYDILGGRNRLPEIKIDPNGERRVSVAIIRNGVTESRGFKTHADLRRALGDENPYNQKRDDIEGFLTSEGRFVDRQEAKRIAVHCGQLDQWWLNVSRKLLSSDLCDW